MDKQKVFDKVVNHLLTQNAKSFDEIAGCMYRGGNGMMCAVGCLITDAGYDPEIESLVMGSLAVNNALEKSGINVDDDEEEYLLRDLQRLHDGFLLYGKNYEVSEWPEGLKSIASHYGLNYKGLTV